MNLSSDWRNPYSNFRNYLNYNGTDHVRDNTRHNFPSNLRKIDRRSTSDSSSSYSSCKTGSSNSSYSDSSRTSSRCDRGPGRNSSDEDDATLNDLIGRLDESYTADKGTDIGSNNNCLDSDDDDLYDDDEDEGNDSDSDISYLDFHDERKRCYFRDPADERPRRVCDGRRRYHDIRRDDDDEIIRRQENEMVQQVFGSRYFM